MKKGILLSIAFLFFGFTALMTGCRAHLAPTEPGSLPTSTGTITIGATSTPTTGGNVTLSGNVYGSLVFTTPVPNLTVTVYSVDGTAARTGAAVLTSSVNASAAFSLVVPANNYYELEVTDGFSTMHEYLPQATATRSGIKLIFASMAGQSSMITGGLMVILNESGNILSTDAITLDGGANLNNSTSSPGTYSAVQMLYTMFGTMAGVINNTVSQSAVPGTAHAVGYKGVVRNVRVIMLSSLHATMAVYY